MYTSPVPDPDRPDPLRRMKVYVLADKLVEDSWPDMEKVRDNPITFEIVGQMYKSIGSIPANISDGYSKSSGKDRAHSFEYALGSARETVDWYHAVKPVLGEELVAERTKVLGDSAPACGDHSARAYAHHSPTKAPNQAKKARRLAPA